MRTAAISPVLALLVSACALTTVVGPPQTIQVGQATITVAGLDGYNRAALQAYDPNGPNVLVPNNTIVLDQEPVRPIATQGRVIIVWRLDASPDSPYSFTDDNAISLQAGPGNPLPPGLNCGAAGPRKKVFICTYSRPETPKDWKYSIRVKNASGPDPTPLDPWIHQN